MENDPRGPATLHARLFGDPRIYYRGRRIDAEIQPQTLIFLAFVMTRCESILRRDEIAYTLWSDATAEASRANLRRHLYSLKRLCGGELPFAVDARTIRIRAPWALWSDAAAFTLLASAGELSAAIELQRATFLAALDHEWIAAKREELRAELCALLRRAASTRYLHGDVVGALRSIERLHTLEPWHEDVLRALVSLRCSIGDRSGAVAAYVNFQARLRTDLGVKPMEATAEHVEALTRGEHVPVDRALFVPAY